MKLADAIRMFHDIDQKYHYYVFSKKNLNVIFSNESERSLEKSIARLITAGILERACRGIYIFAYASSKNSYIIEAIAQKMRYGKGCYVSLESALSEYGLISQIPIGVITIMTTGRAGRHKTPFGIIEFTHTSRGPKQLAERYNLIDGRPLPLAKEWAALGDLKRVGRNLSMIIDDDD